MKNMFNELLCREPQNSGNFFPAGMGTKLKCAINPLASTTQNSNSLSFTVHFVDDYFRTRPVKENRSMERVEEKQHMEFIKKTMQMHENVFKHQVRELHRLYSVQKMLMDELKKEIKRSQFINQQQHLTTTRTTLGNNFNIVQADPSSRERSGSCSGGEYTMKIVKGFDLEMQPGEDISAEASAVEEDQQAGPSVTCRDFSRSSRLAVCSSGSQVDRDISSLMNYSRVNHMNTEGSDEDSEVELTLSIGGSSSSKKVLDSSASFKSERGEEDCSGPNTPMSSSSTAATFDQDRKRPHCLFQGLNINRT